MLKHIKRFLAEEDGFIGAVIGSIAGGLLASSGAKKAANTQAAAGDRASQVQQDMFNTTNEFFQPYRQAGENALRTYTDQVGTEYTQSPGFQFGLDQGIQAVEGSAAARGNLMSGATLQSLNKFGRDYAMQDYDNWLNRVGGIMSTGQASAGQQAALGQNFANNQSNIFAQQGNALAAGQAGAMNNLQQGINNAVGIWNYQNPPTAG